MKHSMTPLFDAYARAVWDKDVEGLLAIYAPDVQAFDMWSDWLRDGRTAVRGAVEGWFDGLGSDRVRVVFEVIRTREAGAMAYTEAFVRFAAVGPDGAELRAMDNRLTWVAERRTEGWQVVHEHTSAPLDQEARAMFSRAG